MDVTEIMARALAKAVDADAVDDGDDDPALTVLMAYAGYVVPEERAAALAGTMATAALRALEEAGYAVVPVEPTPRMCLAGNMQSGMADAVWAAMLAAIRKGE